MAGRPVAGTASVGLKEVAGSVPEAAAMERAGSVTTAVRALRTLLDTSSSAVALTAFSDQMSGRGRVAVHEVLKTLLACEAAAGSESQQSEAVSAAVHELVLVAGESSSQKDCVTWLNDVQA